MSLKIKIWVVVGLLWAWSSFAWAGSYLRVISWNTLHMGWENQCDWDGYARQVWENFGSDASAGAGFDVIFLQEVMQADSPAKFANALAKCSGHHWDYKVSELIGRTSYKERYAVVYRTDRVAICAAYVYNDSADKFEREPYIVRLRHITTGADYTFINWHTIFGTTAQRKQELRDIATVFQTVQQLSTADQDVILLGDHNREATSSYWSYLTSTAQVSPQVSYKVNLPTTLNTSGAFVNAYDHFWFQPDYVSEYAGSGRDYIAHPLEFRQGLSDHAPIWLILYSNGDTD